MCHFSLGRMWQLLDLGVASFATDPPDVQFNYLRKGSGTCGVETH